MPATGPFRCQNSAPAKLVVPTNPAVNSANLPTSRSDVSFASDLAPCTLTENNPVDANPLAVLSASAADPSAGPHVKALFCSPASDGNTLLTPMKKRLPTGKRLSQGYIPRPQNPFMLFRAAFVKQRHVPGSVETTNHSLSKIIGNHWRSLTSEERHVWEVKAKQEKAAHKIRYPEYRFRPIHNKHKKSQPSTSTYAGSSLPKINDNERQTRSKEDERRCDEVAQLLLEGKNGEELIRAVEDLDRARNRERNHQLQLDMDLDYEYSSDPKSSSHGSTPSITMPSVQPTLLQHLSFNSSSYVGVISRHRRSSSAPQTSGQLVYSNTRAIALPTLSPVISRPSSPSAIPSISRFRQTQKEAFHPLQYPIQTQFSESFKEHPEFQGFASPPTTGYSQHFIQQTSLHPGFTSPATDVDASRTCDTLYSDQADLRLFQHRRSISSQPQVLPSVLRRSCIMPAMAQHSFMSSADSTSFDVNINPMSAHAAMERQHGQSLPQVDQQFFDDFSFENDSYVMVSSEVQEQALVFEHLSSSTTPISHPYEQCNDGTINPSSLMRLPVASAPSGKLTPIDTSVHSVLSPSSTYLSEPTSSSSSHSTPMMTPSSPFPSPAPSSWSISSFDGLNTDADFASLLNADYMQLDALYPHGAGSNGMVGLYGMEGEGMFVHDLDADIITISPRRLEEEGALYSKMLDMLTPTRATFGLQSI